MFITDANIQHDPAKILRQVEPLLATAHNSWSIGFALVDRKLCYRFVNDALATMNRVSVKGHIGTPVRTILADTAAKVEPLLDRVFSTGEPVLQYEFSGGLPSRKEEARWRVSYFPIFEGASSVGQVAAMVWDMTILRQLERQFAALLGLRPLLSLSEIETVKPVSLSDLTGREMETIKLLANGNSNKQAAAALGISVRTVESHRAKIMLKLRINSVAELVRFAISRNII
jgi:DNA-binding CsgD family transcriptional regulator